MYQLIKISPRSTIVMLFAFVTRRPYCPGRPKKLCFTTPSLTPMVSTARLGVVKQSSFGLPGQYGRRVTRANCYKDLEICWAYCKTTPLYTSENTIEFLQINNLSLFSIRPSRLGLGRQNKILILQKRALRSLFLAMFSTMQFPYFLKLTFL